MDPLVGKIPWRRAWQYSCLEDPHGQSSYSPRGHNEFDITELLIIAKHCKVYNKSKYLIKKKKKEEETQDLTFKTNKKLPVSYAIFSHFSHV